MAEFNWIPSRGFTSDSSPKVNIAKFGDGYAQRVPAGINNIDKTWNLTFQSQPIATANAIETFLVLKQGAIPFSWLPTGDSTEVQVVCSKWSKVYESHLTSTISATFERVYGYD